MALEKRGGSTYYYRSIRQGKKVKRQYVAAGDDAEYAAAIHDHGRLVHKIQRERIESLRVAWDDAFHALALLGTFSGLMFRRCCCRRIFTDNAKANGGGSVISEKDFPRYTVLEFQEIVQRAERGDESALPELRTILDECPDIWREASNLETQTREMWIDLMVGKNLFRRETIERRLAEMRLELAGPDSSPLERLLVDHLLCSWLAMNYANAMCARHQTGSNTMVRLLWKQRNAAERHILAATRQLIAIRQRLSSPTNPETIKLSMFLTESPMDDSEIRNAANDDPLLQSGVANAAITQPNGIDAAEDQSSGAD